MLHFSYRAIWYIQFLLTPRHAQFYNLQTDDITIDTCLLLNSLLLYVLMKLWSKLPEDGNFAETCSTWIIERTYRLLNCAFVGASRISVFRNPRVLQNVIWWFTLCVETLQVVTLSASRYTPNRWYALFSCELVFLLDCLTPVMRAVRYVETSGPHIQRDMNLNRQCCDIWDLAPCCMFCVGRRRLLAAGDRRSSAGLGYEVLVVLWWSCRVFRATCMSVTLYIVRSVVRMGNACSTIVSVASVQSAAPRDGERKQVTCFVICVTFIYWFILWRRAFWRRLVF